MSNDPAASLSVELERTLVRELLHCWRQINATFFRDALLPPRLALTDSASTLGQWHQQERRIDISRSLVLFHPWSSVLEVLKHEMAHQYAHEVLQAFDETAHGPAFRGVCKRMGVDSRASGLPVVGANGAEDGSRTKLFQRIQALLALAESSNRHEAENAAALAQKLMLKHNIALASSPATKTYAFQQIGKVSGRVSEAEHLLAAIVAEFFFVQALWVPAFRPHDGKRGNVLEISGTPENLAIAEYVHGCLAETGERLWREHKARMKKKSNRERRTFLAGVMEGFYGRLKNERKQNQQTGMVWQADADLHAFHRRRHPHIRSVRVRGHGQSETRAEGRQAGSKIVLRRGVSTGSTTGPRKRLPPASGK